MPVSVALTISSAAHALRVPSLPGGPVLSLMPALVARSCLVKRMLDMLLLL